MMRVGRSGVGAMGIVFGAILLAWFSRTVGGIGNPIGLAGSETVMLLVLFVLVTGGILLAGKRWFTARPSISVTGTTQSDDEAAVEALKHRYVAGEIDEATFERQLETLFETETVEDAKNRAESAQTAADESPTMIPDTSAESDGVQPTSRSVKRSRTRSVRGHCK